VEINPPQLWTDLFGKYTTFPVSNKELAGLPKIPERPRLEVNYYPESFSKLPSSNITVPDEATHCFEGFSSVRIASGLH
jgi:hypothetical protein